MRCINANLNQRNRIWFHFILQLCCINLGFNFLRPTMWVWYSVRCKALSTVSWCFNNWFPPDVLETAQFKRLNCTYTTLPRSSVAARFGFLPNLLHCGTVLGLEGVCSFIRTTLDVGNGNKQNATRIGWTTQKERKLYVNAKCCYSGVM